MSNDELLARAHETLKALLREVECDHEADICYCGDFHTLALLEKEVHKKIALMDLNAATLRTVFLEAIVKESFVYPSGDFFENIPTGELTVELNGRRVSVVPTLDITEETDPAMLEQLGSVERAFVVAPLKDAYHDALYGLLVDNGHFDDRLFDLYGDAVGRALNTYNAALDWTWDSRYLMDRVSLICDAIKNVDKDIEDARRCHNS